MRLTRIKLRNYRNIEFADLKLQGRAQFLTGPNAQGKTNLLEAIGLLPALRSFRTRDSKTLIQLHCPEANLAFYLNNDQSQPIEVWISLNNKGKEVIVDGEKITRFRDFIGRFPVVVISGRDIQLLRGSPSLRREWLNLLLATANPQYYQDLRDYHRILNQRNALLKSAPNSAEMDVFEKLLAEKAAPLFAHRASQIRHLNTEMKRIYHIVSPVPEDPQLHYKPNLNASSPAEYLAAFRANRERDLHLKSTQHGPHRDDIAFHLSSRTAKDYASEGQQRSLIISLKLAQLHYLHHTSNSLPILLADDILEELDSHRKTNFWKAIHPSTQIIAAATTPPPPKPPFQTFQTSNGNFTPKPPAPPN